MSAIFAKCTGCLSVFLINMISSVGTFVYVRAKCSMRGLPKNLRFGLSMASCFSIGLFLGICFLGLYHSASMKMLSVQENFSHKFWLKSYPISEALLCTGFFILWIFEWTIHAVSARVTQRSQPSKTPYSGQDRAMSLSNIDVQSPSVDADDEIDLLDPRDRTTRSDIWSEFPHAARIDRKPVLGAEFQDADSFIKSLLLTSAMGIHAFLEALGFGLLDTVNEVLSMGLAMALHQTLCAATLGLRLARSSRTRSRQCYAILLLIFYLLLLPIGTSIGLGLQSVHSASADRMSASSLACDNSTIPCVSFHTTPNAHDNRQTGALVMSILQNFAASTFLYVVFMEMLPSELSTGTSRGAGCHTSEGSTRERFHHHTLISCFCALLGFGLVACLRLIHHHST